uniref:Reverse transcriptase zinc-binding domain-containing protein n=1 Tax=Fagus sylvatica TaxID=28930 RepID=A0A2N9IIB8_FAGSY
MLICGFFERSKSSSRFENMWLKVEGFSNRVKQWWDSYNYDGSPGFILAQKLKTLKSDLQRWNEEDFGDVNHRRYELMASIQELDMVEDDRPLSAEESSVKSQAKREVEKLLLLDEISRRQKSRVLWLRECDKNASFFHRRANTISRLLVEGVETTNPVVMGEDNAALNLPFTEEEVFGVIKDMARDKAPGLDGFSLAFFQSCWDIVKKDVMEVFHYFHAHGSFERSINAHFSRPNSKKIEGYGISHSGLWSFSSPTYIFGAPSRGVFQKQVDLEFSGGKGGTTIGRLETFVSIQRGKKFEVKSYYKALIRSAQSPFPWRNVWKVKFPTRIAFFTWTAALGKILTIDNLRKRKVIITDWCCMCKRGGESVSHLLLHCPVSQELWGLVFALFWVSWVMPQDVEDLLACWAGRFGDLREQSSRNSRKERPFPTASCGISGARGMPELLMGKKLRFQL